MVNKKSFSAVLATLIILGVVAGTSIAAAQTATTVAIVGPNNTIVATAQATPTLSDLVKALIATKLTGTLNNSTNITVFAPNDAAFAKLGNTTLNDLLTNNTTTLANIIKSHVAVGSVNLTTNGSAQTLAGNQISWNTTANVTKVQLGNTTATILQKNINTTNGTEVNIIDTVLQPPAGATGVASAVASAAGGFLGLPGFEALYAVAGLLAVAYLVMRRRK